LTARAQVDAGVHKGKQRQDHEGDPWVQVVLQLFGQRVIGALFPCIQRDHEGQGYTSKRGMYTGLENADSEYGTQQDVGRPAHNPGPVQGEQCLQSHSGLAICRAPKRISTGVFKKLL
jgi:hypothetical protein